MYCIALFEKYMLIILQDENIPVTVKPVTEKVRTLL